MIILWMLWKRRNTRRYGKDIQFEALVYQCQQMLYYVVKSKFPWVGVTKDQRNMTTTLDAYKPRLYHYPGKWELPGITG